jgi:hypothetical protein
MEPSFTLTKNSTFLKGDKSAAQTENSQRPLWVTSRLSPCYQLGGCYRVESGQRISDSKTNQAGKSLRKTCQSVHVGSV